MKALTEYKALKTVSEKLAFKADGRPGAPAVRADQARIRAKKTTLHYKTEYNLHSANSKYTTYSGTRESRKAVYQYRHDQRQFVVDRFLQAVAFVKKDIEEGSPRELFGLPASAELAGNGIHALGDWYYRTGEDVEYDNDCYSKGWHRKYGGKKTVSNRCVIFKRKTKKSIKTKTVDLGGWRGDWLAKAVLEAGLAPKKPKASIRIRLNRAYDARHIETKRGCKIYSRTLAGQHFDFVIESQLGTIYHDQDRKKLISGLHEKIKASATSNFTGSGINWALCKKLGFCTAGIKSFCDDFDFDTERTYPVSAVYNRVKAHPEKAIQYLPELRILAKAVNFHAPELNS